MPTQNRVIYLFRRLFNISISILLLAACIPQLNSNPQNTVEPTRSPSVTPPPQAEVLFNVQVPAGTVTTQEMYLEVLDEVTGLALNPTRYLMSPSGPDSFTVHLPVSIGSVVKYHYVRGGSPLSVEQTSQGIQVRYRMVVIYSPSQFQDIVAAWNDHPYAGESGRILGTVVDAATGEGIPGVLVLAAGHQSMTSADGSYLFDGIPPGTHLVTAYATDGSYLPFQQGAVVAANASTPASIQLNRANRVNITFLAHVPVIKPENAVLRLIGNTDPLGNTFGDLRGGMSGIASRAPSLSRQADGIYSVVLSLPVGLDLRYKYSLGDGFWNAEHSEEDQFIVRQLIVPDHDLVVEDYVEPWHSSLFAPVTFHVHVPPSTLAEDMVSIQFNPFGWTEPIPMWPEGAGRWTFTLYSPLQILGNMGYRFCRNDQCGIADDISTTGAQSQGWPFTVSRLPQDFEDEVSGWASWQPPTTPTTVISTSVLPRGDGMLAGFELASNYSPSWQAYTDVAFDAVRKSGANVFILTPTWRYTRQNLPNLEPVPGKDMLWSDAVKIGTALQNRAIGAVIFPQIAPVSADWWSTAAHDTAWWTSWFDRYQTFAYHHAGMASKMQARALVLGGSSIEPAFPGGTLPDGTPSNLPEDASQRWQQIINGVRERYKGPVFWAVPYGEISSAAPAFINDLDGIYLLWSRSLTSGPSADLTAEFGRLLDEEIKPYVEINKKPVWVGLSYASFSSAAAGCTPIEESCLPYSLLLPGTQAFAQVDLQEQADIYNAALLALNERNWVTGIFSRGFYPAAQMQDSSSSVYGKPAWDVLWYWYPKLLSQQN